MERNTREMSMTGITVKSEATDSLYTSLSSGHDLNPIYNILATMNDKRRKIIS